MTVRTMTTIEDVYRLLEEKENDLQLAGELGKALLEKNEELTREYDKATQDHYGQIEVWFWGYALTLYLPLPIECNCWGIT